MDYVKAILGNNAVHVPAWLYIQDQGSGVVTFVGSSRTDSPDHPLRCGSPRTHQLIVGEIIVRPHSVLATDALRGDGLASLVTSGHDIDRMLSDGEMLLGRRP
jgi:hypothetical protein